MTEEMVEHTLTGQIIGAGGNTDVADVLVWFAHLPVGGEPESDGRRVETRTDSNGEFVFDLPLEPIQRASVGANLDGTEAVDLEADGEVLEPGDVIIMVDDIVPSHLRNAG